MAETLQERQLNELEALKVNNLKHIIIYYIIINYNLL